MFPPEVADDLDGVWDTKRIETARKSLGAATGTSSPLPQTPVDIQNGLDFWWRELGQFMPRHVLDEIGIQGGLPVPTTLGQIAAEKKESALQLRRVLGLKHEGDPLEDQLVVRPEGPVDPTDLAEPTPQEIETGQMIQSATDEDLEKIAIIMADNPMEFPVELQRSVV